jgi:sensor histidine kinase regulating citrate/malate metabolism
MEEQKKVRFLDRPVRLRWVIRIVMGLVILGVIAYGFQMWQMGRLRGDARQAVRDQIMAKGESVAQSIAITSRDDILNRRYGKLQDYFSDLVSQRDVQYLIVTTPDGRAVVHTDAKYRGKILDDDISKKAAAVDEMRTQDLKADKVYDVAVPVMSFTHKAAVIRVGVSYSAADRVLSVYLLHGLTYGSFSMLFLYRRWGDQAWHWWGFGAGWAAFLYILRAFGIYRHLAAWSPLYDVAALTILLWGCTLLDRWVDRKFHSSRPRARA